jgi:hypothetical protein
MNNQNFSKLHYQGQLGFRSVLAFILHQLLSTIGVIVLAAFLTFTAVSLIHHWQPMIGDKDASRVLTGTLFFPIQVTLSFSLGWWLMRRFGQRSSMLVWIIPAAAVVIALAHGPFFQLGGGPAQYNAWSHFFAHGCDIQEGCLDQVIFTLPLLTAAAYSIGAGLADLAGRAGKAAHAQS